LDANAGCGWWSRRCADVDQGFRPASLGARIRCCRYPRLADMLTTPCLSVLLQAEFNASVDQGFQASPTWHQGSIIAAESTAAGPRMSTGVQGLSRPLQHVLWPNAVFYLQGPQSCCALLRYNVIPSYYWLVLHESYSLTEHLVVACCVACSSKLLLGAEHDAASGLG
jgi:hypothetical protein